MSNERAEVIRNEQYSMKSDYAMNVEEMNRQAMYPSWNAAADKQARYPDATLQGERVRKQVML